VTWSACVAEALTNSHELVAARAAVCASEAAVRVARGSLLPQISGEATVRRGEAAAGQENTAYAYGLSTSQLLFNGGKARNQLARAEQELAVARWRYALVSANVRQVLRQAYINLIKGQRQVEIARDILERRAQSARLIGLRYEGGREHRGSLLTAQARQMEAEYELRRTERELQVARQNLAAALGRRAVAEFFAVEDLAIPTVAEQAPPFAQLAAATPEVQLKQAESEAARFSWKAVQAERIPVVEASAAYERRDTEWPVEEDEWSAGLRMYVPLFTGYRNTAAAGQARAAWEAAAATVEDVGNQAVARLRAAWVDLCSAVEWVAVQSGYVEAARERSRIADEQYSTGLLSFDNWIIIEDEFIRTRKALLEAQTAAWIAEARWLYACGKTLENEQK